MQFEDIVALLPNYLDDNLSPEKRRLVEEELARSAELTEMLENLRSESA